MSDQLIGVIGDETLREFEFPQREAAFFYGLFLRGHSAEELRRDIEVPPMSRGADFDATLKAFGTTTPVLVLRKPSATGIIKNNNSSAAPTAVQPQR